MESACKLFLPYHLPLYQVRNYLHGQNKALDIIYIFDLDNLPIDIRSSLRADNWNDFNDKKMNQSIGLLVGIIKEAEGS